MLYGWRVVAVVYWPRLSSVTIGGRVAPGGCPPGAPTDPYVLALEHTVPQIIHSRRGTPGGAAPLSAGLSLTRGPEVDASDVCPTGGRMIRRPASLHAVPRCVPGFPRFVG